MDSLLIVGNSTKGVEKVVIRLTGGAIPTLGELAAYQASHQAFFREAPFYGWVNVKAIVDTLARKSAETKPPENPDPFEPLKPEKLISATGLASCRTLAFNLQDSSEGSLCQFFLSVPEAAARGSSKSSPAQPKKPVRRRSCRRMPRISSAGAWTAPRPGPRSRRCSTTSPRSPSVP